MQDQNVLEILKQGFSTRAEVADRFDVTERTVDRWIRLGLLDAVKVNGSIRITVASQIRLAEDSWL